MRRWCATGLHACPRGCLSRGWLSSKRRKPKPRRSAVECGEKRLAFRRRAILGGREAGNLRRSKRRRRGRGGENPASQNPEGATFGGSDSSRVRLKAQDPGAEQTLLPIQPLANLDLCLLHCARAAHL